MSSSSQSDVKPALLACTITLATGVAIFWAVFAFGATPEPVPAPATVVPAAAALTPHMEPAAAASSAEPSASQPAATLDPEVVKRGQGLFAKSCVMCHGTAGQGTPMGNNLITSDWVKSASMADVSAVILNGRAKDDAANKSHLPMPPKGGVPSLNEKQIEALAAYCKSIAK